VTRGSQPPTQSALTPLAHGALNHCFGCGLDNPTGLRLKFFVDPDKNVVCHFRLARRFAGPPGHAHGGIIATLLDEAMSKSNRARGILAMTRNLEVQYLRPSPSASSSPSPPVILTPTAAPTTPKPSSPTLPAKSSPPLKPSSSPSLPTSSQKPFQQLNPEPGARYPVPELLDKAC